MKQSKEGSITVFLSLILLLILAVITTTVEAARVSVAEVYTKRALATAMDSVLAEFYLPLFQEYHIFGLEGSYGGEAIDESTITNKLTDYMEYTFSPTKNLSLFEHKIPIKNCNLFGIETKTVDVGTSTTLMDYEGELFANQAVSYMKYKELGNGVESFLDKTSAMKETGTALTVLEEKQKTEEQLFEIDKDILGLMRLIDGISINENGVKTDRHGRILIKDYFVKKFSVSPITRENLGINNDLVYSSIAGHYVNPLDLYDSMLNNVSSILSNLEQIDIASSTYATLIQTDQSHMTRREKRAIRERIEEVEAEIEEYNDIQRNLLDSLKDKINNIKKLNSGILETIESAIPIVDGLIIKQVGAAVKVTEYKTLLLEKKDSLGQDIYKGLSEDLPSMEKYSNADNIQGNYDFQGMKDTLINNQDILLAVQSFPEVSASKASMEELKNFLTSARSKCNQYSHNKLQFDYSTLREPVDSQGFFNSVGSLLENGIMGLVLEDTERISKKEMKATDVPSYLHQVEADANPRDISSSLSSMDIGSKISSITELFSNSKGDFDLVDGALNGGDALGEALLFQEYLFEHFDNYKTEEAEATLKALNYELEYIIMGKSSDYDNLKSVIMRILMIRTMMNLITLISDGKSSNEARTLAIGFVGFTGLPALISIVKTIILSVWAFEEALIDVAAIMEGKSIPLYKKGIDLQIGLQDLLLMNRAFIQGKVAGMKNTDSSILDLSYKDYLRIFLFIEQKEKKSYRAMDLIQENIQIKYEDTFYISNCIFGFRVDAEFQMEMKFLALPFVKQLLDYEEDAFVFHSTQEYSY